MAILNLSSLAKINAHMKTAYIYADLSHAIRKKVGAVLVIEDRIIANGYNGTISGSDNACEYEDEFGELITKDEVLHAEENVILFAAKNGMSTSGSTLYITMSPCFKCSRMIAQCGIKKVIYDEEYRDTRGLDLLRNNKVEVIKLNEFN
jgi:dCMP deaminase